jgi:hypothetical protein
VYAYRLAEEGIQHGKAHYMSRLWSGNMQESEGLSKVWSAARELVNDLFLELARAKD